MQTQKMSLANIKGKLSRAEMKKIMAGSGTPSCGESCSTSSDCRTNSSCSRCVNAYYDCNAAVKECWA